MKLSCNPIWFFNSWNVGKWKILILQSSHCALIHLYRCEKELFSVDFKKKKAILCIILAILGDINRKCEGVDWVHFHT